MEAKLEKVFVRLETVTCKLEGIAAGSGARGSGGGETPEYVAAFETVMNSLSEYYRLSQAIGGEVADISQLVKKAVEEVQRFLQVSGKYKKPADTVVVAQLAGVNSASEAVVTFAENKRSSKAMNNLFAVKEMFPYSFGFLMQVKPKKIPKDALDQGMFYSNRVLKEFRDKDHNQVDWCRSLAKYTSALTTYIEDYLPAGLEWNPDGPPLAPGAVATPPSVAKAPSGTTASGPSIADTLKSGNVTEGLKKVERSQMTHKNPELKASSLVQAKQSGLDSMKSDVTIPKKESVFRLEKKRWRVEHFEGKKDIVVEPTETSQTLYAFNCSKCTIRVANKINSITLDKCFNVAIVFEDVISQFEMVNCQRIEAQSNGGLPLVNIDKTDQVSIYLSDQYRGTEIVQSKSSAMNISIPNESGEYKEIALPEQFRSVMQGSKYVTTPTESI